MADLMKMKASEVATKKVISVDLNDGLEEVSRVLREYHLKKVPVMDNGEMVGMINRSNVMKYIVKVSSEKFA